MQASTLTHFSSHIARDAGNFSFLVLFRMHFKSGLWHACMIITDPSFTQSFTQVFWRKWLFFSCFECEPLGIYLLSFLYCCNEYCIVFLSLYNMYFIFLKGSSAMYTKFQPFIFVQKQEKKTCTKMWVIGIYLYF